MSKELKMPDAQKLADLLISQAWVEVDCQEGYDEFVTSLGCNLYDPAVQPAPGGEDVVLSAARIAPAEPVGVVNAVENKGSTRWDGVIYASAILEDRVKHGTKLYTAPDALQAAGTTSDKYRAELYDEVWQKARDMDYGNVTDALVALYRLKEFKAAYMEWNDKTEWARSIVETKDLGKHLADVMREKFERLREEVERLKNSNEGCEDCFAELMAESKRLVAERDALKDLLRKAESALHKAGNTAPLMGEIEAALAAKPEVDHE